MLNHILRSISIVIVAFLDIFMVLRYRTYKKLKMRQVGLQVDLSIFDSGLFPWLIAELLVCSVCIPPGIDYEWVGYMLGGQYKYSIDDVVTVATFLKMYLLVRIYVHYSLWTNSKTKALW